MDDSQSTKLKIPMTTRKKFLTIPGIIAKKRDGMELDADDINQFITGVSSGSIQDCQVGAMLMAIYLKGMTEFEISALTLSMRDSGERLQWPQFRGNVVDKHSTGGIGDKISIPLAPALAACGLKVPMISGRGLGITGGTLDKLESIPGYVTQLTEEQINDIITNVGCGIFSQSLKLNPADRFLYSIRDVTSTVSHNALIVSSILSKKAIEDLDALILDVKFGKSAFMKTIEDAGVLADWLLKVSKLLGMKTSVFITEMDTPIGNSIGNSIEIIESLELMKYAENHSKDFEDLVCEQGGQLLLLINKVETIEQGRELIRNVLKNGNALAKFRDMMIGHGVSQEIANELITTKNESSVLKLAEKHYVGRATHSGYVMSIDSFKLGTCVQQLGGGRLRSTDKIDYSVGIRLYKHIGDEIGENDIWAELYYNDEKYDFLDDFNSAIEISPVIVPPLQRIRKILT
ncbi:unnamed protein product [Didymodactylos carnosus]|uniref:Thymidine phosphorylase n=1 Tax=Didymodactylos carnosus TaxID=1234261 RepID=A0A814V054_9BILA|nr:unnamed protein product [Didymodactylos carnosus]CAF1401925.1 unnamed protein product [Didymodactylos carnosus]CAF3948867.1 unnamed protein product [Didymodactylos carnosus]CAF4208801.1 unnamed protein product [Didymodactylos carnosus]